MTMDEEVRRAILVTERDRIVHYDIMPAPTLAPRAQRAAPEWAGDPATGPAAWLGIAEFLAVLGWMACYAACWLDLDGARPAREGR